jgi:iron complex outermembrane receptor protein
VTPRLAARVDYSHADGGGYVDRTGDKMQSALAAVRWAPTPALMLKGSFVYTHDHIRSYYGTPIIDGGIDPRTRFVNYNMRDNRNVATNNYSHLDGDVLLPGGWTLHNGFFTATQDVHWRNFESVQFVPASRQVRVASYFLAKRDDFMWGDQTDVRKNFVVAGKTIDVMAGYLYQDNDQDRWTGGTAAPTFMVDPFSPQAIFDPGFPFVFDRNVRVKTHTTFAESRVGLSERFKVVTGLRWERFQVDRNQVTTGFASQRYYPTTGRAGLVYMLNPLVSLYASHSRAVEPVTPLVSINAANMTFSLQPSRQWETGTKATVLGGRVDTTAAYFKINRENMLTSNVVDGVRLTQQIGEQQSQGVEVAATVSPMSSFTLMTDFTALNAEFVEFNENLPTGGIISRAGNGVTHVPATVFNVTPMQRVGPITVSATIRRVGERWRDTANTIRLQPYTLLNTAISTRFMGRTRVTFIGQNLTDEIYIPRGNSDVSGRLGAPRSFEIQVTRVF